MNLRTVLPALAALAIASAGCSPRDPAQADGVWLRCDYKTTTTITGPIGDMIPKSGTTIYKFVEPANALFRYNVADHTLTAINDVEVTPDTVSSTINTTTVDGTAIRLTLSIDRRSLAYNTDDASHFRGVSGFNGDIDMSDEGRCAKISPPPVTTPKQQF